MPIVVVGGSRTLEQSVLHNSASNDKDDVAPIRNLATDMTDVLNLKVYKISRPNFIDGSTTTTLIGDDIFYRHEDEIQHKKADVQTDQVLEKGNRPTLLQHIRAHKRMSAKERKKDNTIMEAVRENTSQFKMVKAGQSVRENLPVPTMEEAIRWAIDHVNAHEHHLVAHLQYLDDMLSSFDSERTKCLPPVSHGNPPAKSRYKGAKSSMQSSEKPPKALSLLQQLDNLKVQGTESFLRAVCAGSESSAQQSRKSEGRNVNNYRASSGKDGSLEPSKPTANKKHNAPAGRQRILRSSNVNEVQNALSSSSKSPRMASGDIDELQPILELLEHAGEDPQSLNVDTEKQMTSMSWDVTHNNSIQQNDVDRENHVEDDNGPSKEGDDVRATEEVSTAIAPKHPSKHKHKPPQIVKYSNAKVDAQSTNQDGKITLATQEAIDDIRRTQTLFLKSLGYTIGIFNKANCKQDLLENDMKKKLIRATSNGRRLFQEFKTFQHVKATADNKASRFCRDRQYHRATNIDARSSIFANGQQSFGDLAGNVFEDMQKLRQESKEWIEARQVRLLLNVKWFVAALTRLRDYLRRMNNQAPLCVLKFLSIIEELIVLEFSINVAVFYGLMLSEIFGKDDFRKNMVHQIIDVVREGVGISPEEFVNFLEAHDMQPSPELMNLVRSNAQVIRSMTTKEKERERKPAVVHFSSPVFQEISLVQVNSQLEEDGPMVDNKPSFTKRIIPVPPPIQTELFSSKNGILTVSSDNV